MKKTCLVMFLFITVSLFAQTTKVGYIIEIEGSNVFVDFTSKDVKVGDRLKVISDQKQMIHPITKEKIIKEGELFATLEITETHSNYSIAGRVYPANAFSKLTVGAKVYLPNDSSIKSAALPKDGKVNVAIGAATINDLVGPGYFGNYVSDMLMGELLDCDKIRLIDRSLLSAQVDEVNLKDAGYVNTDNAIMKGQISGVQYMIQITMQKPDVTNITTGTPVNSILNAASSVSQIVGAPGALSTGLEIGANLTSNVSTSTLRSKVSISARVVDVQTGEVLFMCNGTGSAQGEMQAELEGGALGGLKINGGVDGFKQTITGKAVAIAYRNIGYSLKDFFNGRTSEKVVNAGKTTELTYRNGCIYQGIYRLSNPEVRDILDESVKPYLYFDYQKGGNQKILGIALVGLGAAAGIGTTMLGIAQDPDFDGIQDTTTPIYIVGAVGILSGIATYIAGMGTIKNTVRKYNEYNNRSKNMPSIGMSLTNSGLNLCFKF